MIVYKVDKSSHSKTSSQIQDMTVVLQEIAPSLEILQKLLNDHSAAISTPTVDDFRDSLYKSVSAVIPHARRIADQTQQLCEVSEQASKHLVAVDEHYGAALRDQQGFASPGSRATAHAR